MSFSDQQVKEIISTLTTLAESNLNIAIDLVLNPKWSSSEKNYRLDIRKNIQSHFGNEPSFLDLDRLPQHQGKIISISHSQQLGGYAFCKTTQIGFDIEETARILQPIVFRVCDSDEQKLSIPSPQLWAAKESAFKSAIEVKPQVLSQIKIQSVEELKPHGFIFNGRVDGGGFVKGLTFESYGLTFGISSFSSSAI